MAGSAESPADSRDVSSEAGPGAPLIKDRAEPQAQSKAPANPQHRVHYLDGWRGVSIGLVLLGHFLPQSMTGIANEGVEFFFVLSGRLMAEILFVDKTQLPKFYRRRISRIYPAMFVFVLLTFVGMHWTALAYKPLAAAMALTFTINYGLALAHGVPAIDNLWSLCIEEHAYLLLGLIAFIARRRAIKPVVVIGIIAALSAIDGVVSTTVFHQTYFQSYWRTDARLASIFFSAAAFLVLRNRQVPAWTPLVAAAVAVALMFAPVPIHYSLGSLSLAVAVCTLDRAYKPILNLLSARALTTAGLWSYSIYLWQQPFYRLQHHGDIPVWASIALGLGMGIASYHLIETPTRKWLNAHWRSWKPPFLFAAAPAAA